MLKQSTEQIPRRERTVKGRIPDIEWLFGYEETGKAQSDKFLTKLLRRDWLMVIYSTLLYLLQASPVWALPLITSDVIDTITLRPDGYIWRLVIDAVILFVLLIQNVPTTMWRSSIMNKWIRKTTAEVRSGVIRKLQRLSITYHKEIEEGRVQSKLLRDIENVTAYFTHFMTALIPAVIGAIISALIAIWKSPIIALFFVLLIPVNILLVKLFRRPIRQGHQDFRTENERLSSKLTTTLQMLTLTKAHGLIAQEGTEVDEKIHSVERAGVHLDKTNALFGSVSWITSQLCSAICLFACVAMCLKNYISIGEVVLFQSLFSSISASVLSLINAFPSLTAGKEAVRSLSEIVCATDIEKDDGDIPVPEIFGEVTFENVYYHYPNEEKPVVENFNFHVNRGERIAVVGSSGSGKSTIMNLLIGLLAPTEGRILIDGIPLTDLPLQSYRHFISVVPQNSILFSGTIRENITYGMRRYSEKQLQRAVDDAAVAEFLPSMPHGLDTQVGERGDKLSGGQKQRVSIARALVRDPRILILDEATSALDNVSEYHVQRAIEKLVENRTTFIVAHRLSTIRNADRIIVMDEGKLVETGTYEELIALNGKFAELDKLSRIRESAV
jgi:ATP-binding cassette subfamily B protein